MITRRLSLSSINKTAPYQVWTENGYTFLFRTGDGVTYEIGFVEDYMISDDGDVSQLIISVVNGDASHRDSKIQYTVTAILEEYFKTDYATLVYICDTNDGRQSFRQRLFSIWFHSYSEKVLPPSSLSSNRFPQNNIITLTATRRGAAGPSGTPLRGDRC